MAGDGYRVFTREVLEPEDVQHFLMDQAVMAFDSASQRSAELTVPEAGMVSYLRDTARWEGRTPAASGTSTGGVWVPFARNWGIVTGALPTADTSPNHASPGDLVYSSSLGSVFVCSVSYEWRQVGVRRSGTITNRNAIITTAIADGIGSIPSGFLVYVEGNDRLYLRDDSGSWRLLGGKVGATLTLTTGTGAPQTGWGNHSGTLRHHGNGMATLQFDIDRAGANLTPTSTGDVTNSSLLQLPAGWEAGAPVFLGPGAGGNRAAFGYIPSGQRTVQLTGVTGTADIATGATISLTGTYPLATPGDLDD